MILEAGVRPWPPEVKRGDSQVHEIEILTLLLTDPVIRVEIGPQFVRCSTWLSSHILLVRRLKTAECVPESRTSYWRRNDRSNSLMQSGHEWPISPPASREDLNSPTQRFKRTLCLMLPWTPSIDENICFHLVCYAESSIFIVISKAIVSLSPFSQTLA